MHTRINVIVLIVASVWLVGCSSFSRQWKALADTPVPADDITGRWDGSWTSEPSGHHGRLRCIVTRIDDKHYEAWFHAVYAKVLTYTYRLELEAEPDGDGKTLRGSEDLGWLAGGEYHYTGHATPQRFHANYETKSDHGTFEMTRPPPVDD